MLDVSTTYYLLWGRGLHMNGEELSRGEVKNEVIVYMNRQDVVFLS